MSANFDMGSDGVDQLLMGYCDRITLFASRFMLCCRSKNVWRIAAPFKLRVDSGHVRVELFLQMLMNLIQVLTRHFILGVYFKSLLKKHDCFVVKLLFCASAAQII
jgi:hypothetical protein